MAVAALLVFGGFVALAAPHVQLVPSVRTSTGTSIAETAVAQFHFQTFGYDQVPVNSTINVTFWDNDTTKAAHTFTIIDHEGVQIPNSPSTDLASITSTYGTLVWINASYGQAISATFTSPGPGWYEFVCEVAGHFQLGMYGFIAFGMNVPPNLTGSSGPTGPGLPVFIIVSTIVALTVLAIVLGFVFGRREGSVHEMPPERLGYPESTPPTEAPPAGPPRPPA